MNDQLINQFKNAHQELLRLIDKVQADQRESVLFDKWSLKDILGHVSAWNLLYIQTIKDWRDKKNLVQASDEDELNEEEVSTRKSLSWDEVYDEFNKSADLVVDFYKNLAAEFWDEKMRFMSLVENKDGDFTARGYLKSNIAHYEQEHIPQLKSLLGEK